MKELSPSPSSLCFIYHLKLIDHFVKKDSVWITVKAHVSLLKQSFRAAPIPFS